jgi:hypothetical protein
MLDLSPAFPLPSFVKMCFKLFFCGTYLMKKDTKISKYSHILKYQLSMPLEALD